jgi:hypothetical protein
MQTGFGRPITTRQPWPSGQNGDLYYPLWIAHGKQTPANQIAERCLTWIAHGILLEEAIARTGFDVRVYIDGSGCLSWPPTDRPSPARYCF